MVGGNWITDVRKTRNHGYDVIAAESYLLITPITLKTAGYALNPNSNQQVAGRYQLFPVGGMLNVRSIERLLSEKSGRCGIAADGRCGALPMIDRGDIRQAIDRCSNIWGFTAGRWLWSVRA